MMAPLSWHTLDAHTITPRGGRQLPQMGQARTPPHRYYQHKNIVGESSEMFVIIHNYELKASFSRKYS